MASFKVRRTKTYGLHKVCSHNKMDVDDLQVCKTINLNKKAKLKFMYIFSEHPTDYLNERKRYLVL